MNLLVVLRVSLVSRASLLTHHYLQVKVEIDLLPLLLQLSQHLCDDVEAGFRRVAERRVKSAAIVGDVAREQVVDEERVLHALPQIDLFLDLHLAAVHFHLVHVALRRF